MTGRCRRWFASVVGVLCLVAACSSSDEAQPDTPESRCRQVCSSAKDNPCFNTAATDTSCTSACVARLTGKTTECQACLRVHAGWKGESCKCDDAFGAFGSFSCKTCHWQSQSYSCGSQVGNSCPPVAGCEGLVMTPPDCASVCGDAPIADAGTD